MNRQRIVMLIILVAGVVVFAVVRFNNREPGTKPINSNVGDCLHQVGFTSVEPASCDAANATYKVVGRVEGKLQAQVQSLNSGCEQWPETTTTYWEGKPGQFGTVFCLAPNK